MMRQDETVMPQKCHKKCHKTHQIYYRAVVYGEFEKHKKIMWRENKNTEIHRIIDYAKIWHKA